MPNHVHAAYSWGSILITLAILAVGLVYVFGWLKLRREFLNVIGVHRLAEFQAGLLVLWVAVSSPLATLDHQLLTAHMVQHLLLMTVAAPLILLGAPLVVVLHGLPSHAAHSVSRLLGNHKLQKLGRVVAHPAFCWFAGTGTVIAWHIPALFQVGMRSETWHAVEHSSFLAAGLLFWWPVIVPWPSVARWSEWSAPLYLFLATLPCDALSAFLAFCNRVVYPNYVYVHYQSAPRAYVLSPLDDQAMAGALMWAWVTFAYLGPAAVITIRVLSPRRHHSQVEVV
jgi:putative membrane protein